MAVTPQLGGTYNIYNRGNNCLLNLYASNQVANGLNVVLWTVADGTPEQKWIVKSAPDGGYKLGAGYNSNYVLDRYNLLGNSKHNNADIWIDSSSEEGNQAIDFIETTANRFKIKLRYTNLYLTAYAGAANGNGSEAGKIPGAVGNVFWAEEQNNNYQQWAFGSVSGGGSTSDEYCWPTESRSVVRYNTSTHDGADIAPKTSQVPGDKVFAFMDGYVSMTGTPSSNPNEGYTVRIHHTNPLNNGYAHIRTQYMHLQSAPLVSAYQRVTAGQLIGYMGNTGNVSPAPTPSAPGAGTHLHFEVRGGTTSQFPLGGASSNGFYTGTVLNAKDYLDLT